MSTERKDPSNPGHQHPGGNPSPQNPPQSQNPPQTDPCPDPPPVQTNPPQTPCPDPTPPAPTPSDPCKGVSPPTDPGCYPPKTPSEKDCTPEDPCADYYQTHDCSDCEGPCKCSERPCNSDPVSGTIRQQLTTIEDLVNNPPPGTPADATTQLGKDLTALEAEYAGLAVLVTKFDTDRTKTIECEFVSARKWYDAIHKLCDSNLHCDVTHQDIQEAYNRSKQKEREACCGYIRKQSQIQTSLDCSAQAVQRKTEAFSDLELLKTLSQTFIDRLKDLQTIFTDAGAAADNRDYKKVCALKLEFDGMWFHLFTVETTCYRRKNCCVCCPPCDLLPNTLPCWTVERYRTELQKALKALIAATYNHYLWNVYTLKQQEELKKLNDACKTISEKRRARFLAEAEEARDCPSPTTPGNPGDCGCGKQHKGE